MSMFFKSVRLLIQEKTFFLHVLQLHNSKWHLWKSFWGETTIFADLGDGQMASPGFSAKYCTYIHGISQQWYFSNGFCRQKKY